MRTRLPVTFSPDGWVTVTVTGLRTRPTCPAPRPRPPTAPPETHVVCSAFGSEMRVAMPCRSPVAEWHELHFAWKYFSPAAASPTTMFGGGAATPGGPP